MRRIRQLRSALLGAVVLVAVLLGAAGPASAHDALESTSPAAGATLAAPPEQVALTFSRNPLALGSQILVNDASGANWSDGPVAIVDNVAAQKLKSGAPAGQYTVHWRMASSDGHPIEGSFTFTATACWYDGGCRGPHDGHRPAGRHVGAGACAGRVPAVPVERRDLRCGGRGHPGGFGCDGQTPSHAGLRRRHRRLRLETA